LTTEIAIVLGILAVAIILFITERIRVDLVALIVLVSLALTNLVTPAEAISGFSNIAVVTVWAILILSAGLSRTGVANVVGRQLLRFAGDSELRLVAIIMVTAGILSGFMNSIGVAALFLTDGANFRNPHYHQLSDRVGTLDFEFMANIVRVAVATVAKQAGIQHAGFAVSEPFTIDSSVGTQAQTFSDLKRSFRARKP